MTFKALNIPLSAPDIGEAEIEAVVSVLRGQRLSLGPKMEEFEQRVAEYTGVPHGVAVSSGTSGLHLCMRALELGPGDEVIVPSFTFVAAANAIRYQGATPVFVDIDPVTLSLDPEKVASAISKRTRAILVVHTFGCPAEMAELLALAHRHNLLVIEDACEAIGAEYEEKKAGSFGTVGVFAFYPNKQITTGEGGMIVTGDASLAARMKALRNQGRYDFDDWLQHAEVGYNYRISEINCALGIEQFKRIDSILQRREEIAREYNQFLLDNRDLVLPPIELPSRRLSWFVYVVRLCDRFTQQDRDAVLAELTQQGIGCGRYFAPIHLQPSYAEWNGLSGLEVTEAAGARTLALPFFNRITTEQIRQVCSALQKAISRIVDEKSKHLR
ncbi:MAG TPA: DegT/DnrJ/EryC1/StrS family aminotransferase [Acidobacteriaceae bacterium]|jgi:perosamine synthetase|nr:DegT/DnrJ/EryC1/StrS family aminotransferase [Acidobacteriaceae bacterium]